MPATNVGTSEQLLAELSTWVQMETPTTDPAAVNRLMDVVEADLTQAGAAITHIHVRYDDGRPSMELAHYKEVVDRIRDSGVDVIINGRDEANYFLSGRSGIAVQVGHDPGDGPDLCRGLLVEARLPRHRPGLGHRQ